MQQQQQPKINQLLKRCEQYLLQTSYGNQDELMSDRQSDGEHNQADDDEVGLIGYRTKKRKYIYAVNNRCSFFLPFLLWAIFTSGYFIGTYFINT